MKTNEVKDKPKAKGLKQASEVFTLQTEAEFKLKVKIAGNLLNIGLSVEAIAKSTNLTVALIEKLRPEK